MTQPAPRPTLVRTLDRPSLRWRLRRWLLKKLDAWPRERPEPRTEWGRVRRADRHRMQRENTRLRALLERIERDWPWVVAMARDDSAVEEARKP